MISTTSGVTFSRKIAKHARITQLARLKVNRIEDLISRAPNDDKITEEEFTRILAEEGQYNQMKRGIRDHNDHRYG